MPNKNLNFDAVREAALKLAGVEEGAIRGAPSLKFGSKLLVCPALHKSAEADSIVVRVGFDQRALLISTDPGTYYVTSHYANYPMILARLARLNKSSLQKLLEISWQSANEKPIKAKKAPVPKSASRKKRKSP